ncbi:MAG: hypothetical protein RLY70_4446 [Planctomycetota bacterium]|jgi:hypothetical protein
MSVDRPNPTSPARVANIRRANVTGNRRFPDIRETRFPPYPRREKYAINRYGKMTYREDTGPESGLASQCFYYY